MTDESATGQAIVDLAAQHIGEVYTLGERVRKDDAAWKGPWDCSEFCSWLVYQVSGRLYGCDEDSGNPASAKAYTGYWRTDADSLGKRITVEEARRTAGAFILRVPTTATGHIVVSDGKGGTIEAMGKAYGVRRGPVSGRVWDFGILVPWISYGAAPAQQTGPLHPEEPPPSETVLVLRRNDHMTPDPRVEALQRALAASGHDPGPIDGEFGPLTETAVYEYQAENKLFVDGEVGPETGRALKLAFWKSADELPDYHRPAPPQQLPPPEADWPDETRPVNPSLDFNVIHDEYVNLWNTMAIHPDRLHDAGALADMIVKGADRYKSVAAQFSNQLPWYVVGILHAMECDCKFREHLHNGDPLTARTVNVPKNRPPMWDPSWQWEVSAHDAITVDGLDKVSDWTLPRILFTFERYNGFGPRRRFGRATAYLWSFSNHFVRGKYVGDGQWDPEAPSDQVGAAVLLRELIDSRAITAPPEA
jgi:N-acetylmuramoyl-L-alanine amidase